MVLDALSVDYDSLGDVLAVLCINYNFFKGVVELSYSK